MSNTKVHFTELLKENLYCSYFEVVVDEKGTVTSFTSDFGNETLEDIQKLVNVLVRHGGITINGKGQVIHISIDDIGDDENPYCIDVFHDLMDGVQDEDSVIPFTQELIDEFIVG